MLLLLFFDAQDEEEISDTVVDLDGLDGWGSSWFSSGSRSGLSNTSGTSWSSDLLALWEVSALSDTAVLGEVEVQGTVVPLGGEEEDEDGEEWDGQEIEDTEEDEALSLANLVAAIRDTVGDGVEKPEEDEPTGDEEVVAADGEAASADSADVEEGAPEEKFSEETEGEESPFVGGLDVDTREPGSNPDPQQSNVVDDGGPGDAREETNGDDDWDPADEPVDVTSEEDLSGAWVVAERVDLSDGDASDIRSLSVVCDGADEKGDDVEVVEDLLTVLGEVGQGDDREEDEEVDGGYSPEPVGAASGEVVVGGGRIDFEGIV